MNTDVVPLREAAVILGLDVRAAESALRRAGITSGYPLAAVEWLRDNRPGRGTRTDLKENAMTPMWTLEFSARTLGAAYDLARQAQIPGKLALGVSEGGRLGYEATGPYAAVQALQDVVPGRTYLSKC